MEVRVSKILIYYYFSLSFSILLLFLFFSLKWGKMFVFLGLITTSVCFIYALFLKSKVIYVSEMDANYKSWLVSKAIRQIESIDVIGFWIFNHICIVGRGGSVIKLKFIGNLPEVAKLAQNTLKKA